ncbi:MAG: polynucleotide kinase-phosphatase [Myxococcota bacterium]
MRIEVPELALVLLIGASGSGKSTFARKHFRESEVLSSDFCRGLVSNDENDQSATNDAFDVLHYIARKRLSRGLLTVVDATNVQPEARKPLIRLARDMHCLPLGIVLNLPAKTCHARNAGRADRSFGPHVVRHQTSQLKQSLRRFKREGLRYVTVLRSQDDVEAAFIVRRPLWNNLRHEHGPFDVIGDIHGCHDELRALLEKLGYRADHDGVYAHEAGRKAIFLGDLVDRGPASPAVLRLVMAMVDHGSALCVPGNHDVKLMRKLSGRDVRLTHGLAETLEQLESESDVFKEKVRAFIDGLVSHYVLDDGGLVVAHAGLKGELQGRASGKVREFALYGETTGETDAFGLPIRYDWARQYRGRSLVVYGHTPVPQAEWVNGTICIDTGCVFGGKLTALRYPEKELVHVEAAKMYYEPAKPFLPDTVPLPDTGHTVGAEEKRPADVLDILDVTGKRIVNTRVDHTVTIREENAAAALEVMSRFAIDPRWLIYLPPTMSPPETSSKEGLLERPAEAFAYYRDHGVAKVVCEEKHMGSRAIAVVCQSEKVAAKRFSIEDGRAGVVYTRTGRSFFNDQAWERRVVEELRAAVDRAALWAELTTDWLCLDCELMPWSVKAQELIRGQYAPVGASSRAGLGDAVAALEKRAVHDDDGKADELLAHFRKRRDRTERYVAAYRRYCWDVASADDLRVAPFHILASERSVHTDKDHLWHMNAIARLCHEAHPIVHRTDFKVVDVTDADSQAEGVRWWSELTGNGGEGMVVKPFGWLHRGRRGLVQPALKCRGPEYLRIIYGPEYTAPERLARLRARHVTTKRKLARKEFALGLEALHRFVEHEPLYRVHECVFGVLALESEPVDPRL